MAAGTDVGDVYIDVHADTKTLEREIRKVAEAAGTTFGKDFNDTLNSELNSNFSKVGQSIRNNLSKEGVRSGKGFGQTLRKSVEAEIRKWDLDIGRGIVFDDWSKAVNGFDNIDDAVVRVQKRLEDLRDTGELTDLRYDDAVRSLVEYRNEITRTEVEQNRLAAALDRTEFLRVEKEIDGSLGSMRRFRDESNKTFSLLGRLSGSRNDFLNFIGGIGRAFENLPSLIGRAVKPIGEVGQAITDMFDAGRDAQGFFKTIGAGMRSLGGSFSRLAKSGPGVVAALVAIVAQLIAVSKSITSFAAGFASLGGILVTFAGSLVNSLGAALLSVGPMLGALAVGAGAVAAGISGMTKETERALKPVKEFWKEMSRGVSGRLFAGINQGVEDFVGVLKSLRPILNESASAVNQWAKDFLDALSGGAMQKNLKVFEVTWPKILGNLGTAFTNAFTGVSGVLAAISPSVERITSGIAEAAKEFSDWANEAENKNKIAKWFDDAWATATKFKDILVDVAAGLGSLFGASKEDGDSLLDSISKVAQEFRDWAADEENQEKIRTFFRDARDTAYALGEIISTIGQALKEWNTEENRQDFITILKTVDSIAGSVVKVIGFFDKLGGVVSRVAGFVSNIGEEIGNIFGGDAEGFGFIDKIKESLSDFSLEDAFKDFNNWGDSLDPSPAIEEFFGKISDAFRNYDFSSSAIGQVAPKIKSAFEEAIRGLAIDLLGIKFNFEALGLTFKTRITTFFQNVDFSELGQDIIDGIITGITGGGWIGLAGVVQNFINEVKALFGISSPATTMIPIGKDLALGIIQGLVNNIVTGAGQILSALTGLFTTIIPQVISKIGELLQPVGQVLAAPFQKARETIGPILTGIGTRVGEAFDGIRTKVTTVSGQIADGVRTGFNKARTAVGNSLEGIKENISTGWNTARNKVSSTVKQIGDRVSSGFNDQRTKVRTTMKDIASTLAERWSAGRGSTNTNTDRMTGDVRDSFSQMDSTVTNRMNQIRQQIRDSWNQARSQTGTAMNQMRSAVASGMSAMRNAVDSGMAQIDSAVSRGMASAVAEVRQGMNEMQGAVQSGMPGVVSPFYQLEGDIQAAVGGINLYSAGQSIMSSLVAGIRSMAGAAAAAVRDEMSRARALIPSSPAKEGPFSGRGWTTYSGQAIIDGLVEGIRSRSGSLDRALSGALGGARRTLAFSDNAGLVSPQLLSLVGAGGTGSTTYNRNRSLSVAPGAIVVQAPQSDPRLVASQVMDRLVRSNI